MRCEVYLKCLTRMGMEMTIFGNDEYFVSLSTCVGHLKIDQNRALKVLHLFGNETDFVWEWQQIFPRHCLICSWGVLIIYKMTNVIDCMIRRWPFKDIVSMRVISYVGKLSICLFDFLTEIVMWDNWKTGVKFYNPFSNVKLYWEQQANDVNECGNLGKIMFIHNALLIYIPVL